MKNWDHRGKHLRRRILNLSKSDPGLPDRILKNMAKRPWLGARVDPNLAFLEELDEPSVDHLISIGLAIESWPNWLLFGESDVLLPSAEFYELLVSSLARLDPETTGETKMWMIKQLNLDHIATPREVDGWLTAKRGPRADLIERIESVLNLKPGAIDPNPVPKMRSKEPFEIQHISQNFEEGTSRYPRGNAPVNVRKFVPVAEKLKGRPNSQRIARVLSEAADMEVSTAILAKWVRGELIPSDLEIRMLNLAPIIPPEDIERYRYDLDLARKLLRSAEVIMAARFRLIIDFRERVAAAMDASGVAPLTSPKAERLSAIRNMGYLEVPAWAKSDIMPSEADLEKLVHATGIHRVWFTDGIASPHSVMGL